LLLVTLVPASGGQGSRHLTGYSTEEDELNRDLADTSGTEEPLGGFQQSGLDFRVVLAQPPSGSRPPECRAWTAATKAAAAFDQLLEEG
jgi:hypothetical protein